MQKASSPCRCSRTRRRRPPVMVCAPVSTSVTRHGSARVLCKVVVLLPRSQVTSEDRKSTRLNSSHGYISYAVFCLKQKTTRLNSSHAHTPHPAFRLNKHPVDPPLPAGPPPPLRRAPDRRPPPRPPPAPALAPSAPR